MLDGRIDAAERFLDAHPFERGLWLVVAFAAGIVLWVALPSRADWIAALLALGAIAILGLLAINAEKRPHLRLAMAGLAIMVAAGEVTIWARSTLVGQPGIARPQVSALAGEVLERREEPAKARARLVLRVMLDGMAGIEQLVRNFGMAF